VPCPGCITQKSSRSLPFAESVLVTGGTASEVPLFAISIFRFPLVHASQLQHDLSLGFRFRKILDLACCRRWGGWGGQIRAPGFSFRRSAHITPAAQSEVVGDHRSSGGHNCTGVPKLGELEDGSTGLFSCNQLGPATPGCRPAPVSDWRTSKSIEGVKPRFTGCPVCQNKDWKEQSAAQHRNFLTDHQIVEICILVAL